MLPPADQKDTRSALTSREEANCEGGYLLQRTKIRKTSRLTPERADFFFC